MKTKLFKSLTCVLGFFAVMCFALAIMFSAQKTPVGATEIISSDINAEYSVGDELVMPATVKIQVNEDTQIDGANGVLVFPDGTLHNNSSYVLETQGEYKAIYYGTYDGKTVKAVKSINVLAKNWRFTTDSSKISYSDELYATKTAGISVSLDEGDAFVFDQRVDLNELISATGDETVDVISINPKYWVKGNTQNSFQTLSVKLVDCYDAENFVEFYYWAPAGDVPYTSNGDGTYTKKGATTYCGAGASNQELTGMEIGSWVKNPNASFDGYTGRLRYSSRYKASGTYGAVGVYGIQSLVYNPDQDTSSQSACSVIKFRYNPTTGHAFAQGTSTNFLTSVKSEYVYPGNTFKGFTTGEVYVQVQCFNYLYGEPIDLEITSILGISGEGLQKSSVKDAVAPIVEFEAQNTDDTGVNITKGKEFTIPTPTVYDINYQGDLDVAVYYNYGSDNPIAVYLKDNKFTPKNLGKYTAVYTATDSFGNSTVATYEMNSIEDAQFSYDQNNKLTKLVASTTEEIPTMEVKGINLDVDTKIYVIDPAGKITDVTDSKEIDVNYTGTYTVRYVFTDNVTSETFDYTVNTEDQSKVLFNDEFKVASYLIKNATYDFDEYYVYKASANGLEKVLADVYVKVDDAEFVKIADINEYNVTGNQSITFKAVYGDNEKVLTASKIVDVKFTENDKDYKSYFQGNFDEDSVTPNSSFISYSFKADTENKSMEFINPLLYSSFQLDVRVPEESEYKYSVILSEFGNSKNWVKISYEYDKTKDVLIISKEESNGTVASEELSARLVANHSLFIKDGNFNTTEGVSFSAPEFNDYRTLVKVEIESDKDCTINISKVGNSNFTKRVTRTNEAKAQLYYTRKVTGYTLGTVVEAPEAYAISVFNPILAKNVTVSVSDNDKTQFIENADGVIKDKISTSAYSFELSYLGIFRVTYNISYTNGKTTKSEEVTYIMTCKDDAGPVISFEDGINENTVITIKAGKTHKIKSFTVTDNNTVAEELFTRVVIFTDKYATVAYDVMNNFQGEWTFTEAGNYIVQVYCQDADGNYSIAYYNICVKEK